MTNKTSDDKCDECTKTLGDNPIYDHDDCTQFCSVECRDAWEEDMRDD